MPSVALAGEALDLTVALALALRARAAGGHGDLAALAERLERTRPG